MEAIKQHIRNSVRRVAHWVNHLSHGKITPNQVTIVGLLAHIPIAWLIATGNNVWAAILLIIFGLFDTLDGELARLQKRTSAQGMFLDASTDRMKEVLIYSGAAYALAASAHPMAAVWAVGACGASLCVSYVKAKGEAAIATQKNFDPAALNRVFKDGFFTFEVRMAAIILGVLLNQLLIAVVVVTIFAAFTALQRLIRIFKALTDVHH